MLTKSFCQARLVFLALVVGCMSHSDNYTVEQDDKAMQEIAGFWREGESGVQVSLCEDRARSQAWNTPGDCMEAHVVRGEGRGLEHELSLPSHGCGGCPFSNVAYVLGAVRANGATDLRTLEGEVTLAIDSDDPYGYPYRLSLGCRNNATSCTLIDGSLEEDGTLQLSITRISSGITLSESNHTLTRVGAAVCPAAF